MISILIPIYNYNVENLILKLKEELIRENYNFEIICCDDFSSNNYNSELEKNSVVTFVKNETNIGRTETRQKLANLATHNWLLFLDADVIPEKEIFLKTYLKAITEKDFKVCFGGVTYKDLTIENNQNLRLNYGLKKEGVDYEVRLKNPYKTICSANLLIEKNVFTTINNSLKGNLYGYDNIFAVKLKQQKKVVHHLDNAVFHLGLEDNRSYLKKKELAAETLYNAYLKGEIKESDNQLLKTYVFLNKIKVVKLFSCIFCKFNKHMKRNILGKNPSIFLLNCYRLGYFCSLSKKCS